MLFAIHAVVSIPMPESAEKGGHVTRQIPTFYIDSHLQGINYDDHTAAEQIAKDVLTSVLYGTERAAMINNLTVSAFPRHTNS